MTDLDATSINYIESKPDYRADLLIFRNHLLEKAPPTRITSITCVIRFLEDNEITLPKQLIKNLKGKETDPISEEFVPENADLARMIEYLPLIGKTLVLTLSSSGMRIGECLALKVSDIDLTRAPAKITIPAEITKTKKKRIAFVSSEARQLIDEWVGYREKWIKTQEARSIYGFDVKDRLFPIGESSFMSLWKRALGKANLLKIDARTRRMTLHPHSLRKFFRTRGNWTNPDIAEALMGHIAGLKGTYARYDQAEKALEDGYLASEPYLSISANSKTISSLREKVERQSDDITQLVTNLSVKNAKLENELTQIKADLPRMIEFVMKGQVEVLEEKIDFLTEHYQS